MSILFIIPARAGSKGLPGKNVKKLGNKPLIEYSIDFALQNLGSADELCISTDDVAVLAIAKKRKINIPFIRPAYLATDQANTRDVILHALNYYEQQNKFFDQVLLLQPTSPFRLTDDLKNLKKAFTNICDMAVTVKKSKESPYFTLFEENEEGNLEKSKKGNFEQRQLAPAVYAFNGSMYLINCASIKNLNFHEFKNVKKSLMPDERSVDIDNILDWYLCEILLKTTSVLNDKQ